MQCNRIYSLKVTSFELTLRLTDAILIVKKLGNYRRNMGMQVKCGRNATDIAHSIALHF